MSKKDFIALADVHRGQVWAKRRQTRERTMKHMNARDILARNLAWTREHAGTTWLDFIRTHDDTIHTEEATSHDNEETQGNTQDAQTHA